MINKVCINVISVKLFSIDRIFEDKVVDVKNIFCGCIEIVFISRFRVVIVNGFKNWIFVDICIMDFCSKIDICSCIKVIVSNY